MTSKVSLTPSLKSSLMKRKTSTYYVLVYRPLIKSYLAIKRTEYLTHRTMASVFGTVLGITLVCWINAASELLQNADFESTSFSGNWVTVDCTLTSRSDDKFHGAHSVMISNRRVLCQFHWTLIYSRTGLR